MTENMSKIPADMMARLLNHAIYGLKDEADKKAIALTADMIINNQEFGEKLIAIAIAIAIAITIARASD